MNKKKGGKKGVLKGKEGIVTLKLGEEWVEKYGVIHGHSLKLFDDEGHAKNPKMSKKDKYSLKYALINTGEEEEDALIEMDIRLLLKVSKEELEEWRNSMEQSSQGQLYEKDEEEEKKDTKKGKGKKDDKEEEVEKDPKGKK